MKIIKLIREIDYSKSVQVYRNLKYRDDVIYSIKQSGKLVAHATDIKLKEVHFKVSKKGVDRIRLKRQKEVVAYVKGYLCTDSFNILNKIKFNPYYDYYFHSEGVEVKQSEFVSLSKEGVFIN